MKQRVKSLASRDNPHFKALKKICHNGHARRAAGIIVLDGMHLVESYTESCRRLGGRLEEIVIADSAQDKPEVARYLAVLPANVPVTVLADRLFDELALVRSPSGILALATRLSCPTAPDAASDAVLLDGIQDPGNVGSILRSAAAAGFSQALLTADCAQAWSPKVLRAAMGAHFLLSIHENVDLCAFINRYCGRTLATTLNAASRPLFSTDGFDGIDLAQSMRPIAWVFGNEGQGIRPAVAACVSCCVRIPMPGAAESLNVAAAAAICLFETVRQRGGASPQRVP